MSKKTIVVFGATGNQGGSIINTFLEDAELSKKYHMRAVTRNVNKVEAMALQSKSAEVVQGDVDDALSLPRVLRGAHAVYLVTFTVYDDQLKEREFRQGKAVADAAVAAHVSQIVFSTLPPASTISKNKYAVTAFDVKYEIEQYIRTLPIKSAFFAPGSFMQNFQTWMHPQPTGDGTYVISGISSQSSELPLIDIFADTGKWVAAAVENPDKYQGKIFCAATRVYTMDEILQILQKKTGKTVNYRQIPVETYKSYLPPGSQDPLTAMHLYTEECGYYGPDTRSLVEWSAQQARGQLTTFEQYLVNNPLRLD
ncbi:hypothetical protein BGZ83_010247 [Gryganskiella cystojenkinii]|nr:hypothetical protein BGZ83_010247 [Gryganskiella cystojenkinii]